MSTESPPEPKNEAADARANPVAGPALSAAVSGGAKSGESSRFALKLADAGLTLLFLGLTFLLGMFPLKDADFYWHLRTGDRIRQSGQIPRVDDYTFTPRRCSMDRPALDVSGRH